MKRIIFAVLFVAVGWSLAAEEFVRTTVPLARNGHNLFLARLTGEKSDPQKNLLLTHGMTFASHYFDLRFKDYSLMEFFARNGWTVWRLDITGFGESDAVADGFLPSSDYAADDIGAAVEKIREQSGGGKVNLLGWSWGTVTTAKYAAKHPETLAHLVLYAPIVTGIMPEAQTVTEPFVRDAWKGAATDFRFGADGKVDENFAEPELVAAYAESCRAHDKPLIPNASRREVMTATTNILIRAEQIKTPTLLIYGSGDKYLNFEQIRESFKSLPPASEAVVINGGSHPVYIERPFYKQFRERVLSFLND